MGYENLRVSDHDQMIPKVLLRAVLALVLTTLALVTYATLTDRPVSAPNHAGVIVAEQIIQMNAREDGGTTVLATDGEVLADTPANVDGFLTTVRNALQHERRLHGIQTNPPVVLVRFADGRLGLRDDATGWKISLIGFGQDNARAFAQLMREAS